MAMNGALWMTEHSGKMTGINSIGTSCANNPHCIKRRENGESVCSKCYAETYMKMRKALKEHLEDKFFGMIRRVIAKAGSDIPEFARMANSFSVKPSLIYKIGWIIKPFAKILGNLKIGHLAPLCKKESGLKKADWQDIKDERVVDFIVSLVANLFGGDSPYSPDTAHYKITMGILAIIDSMEDGKITFREE